MAEYLVTCESKGKKIGAAKIVQADDIIAAVELARSVQRERGAASSIVRPVKR